MFGKNDLNFFRFLRSAMDFKHRPGNWEKEAFNGIKFDPYINFWTARLVSARRLPEKYKNIFKDRKVFDEAYKNLAFRKELQFLNNPYQLKDLPEEQGLADETHAQIAQEAQSISPQAAQTVYPVESASSGANMPHVPIMPSGQTQGGITTAVLEKETEMQDETRGADRTENMENTPTSPHQEVPQAFQKAFENEPESALDPAKPPVVKPVEKTAPPASVNILKTPVAVPAGLRSGFKNFSSNAQIFFKRNFGGFTNIFKNTFSSGKIFFQRNFGKFATLGNFGTMASGFIGGALGGGLAAGNPFGIAAGMGGGVGFRYWVSGGGAGPFFSKLGNGIINAGSRVSNQIAGPRASALKKTAGKRILFLILGFFLLSGLIGAVFAPSSTSTTPGSQTSQTRGSGCPDTSTNRTSCQYLNPSVDLFQNTLSLSDLESYINKYSPVFINAGKGDLNEFRQRINYIVSNAQTAGLNPAIFLGYWKSESNFSTQGSRDMGCVGDTFYQQVDCALGIKDYSDPAKNPIANCAKSKDANSVACKTLKAIRKDEDLLNPINYPIATIDDFAESYGPYSDLTNGAPTNCSHTYNTLIEAAKELNSCKTGTSVTGGQSNITATASQITQLLSKGTDGFLNVKQDEPGVYYWCTFLVVDSYNKAGYTGLDRSSHGRVLAMKSFFANTQGFKLLNPDTSVTQLKPGDVIFFEGSGDQHASLVKTIDLDQLGNGVIKTYESNNIVTEDSVFVKEFKATRAQTTSSKYSITGFGTVAQP